MYSTKQRLLDILTQLQADVQDYINGNGAHDAINPYNGICAHIDHEECSQEHYVAQTLMQQWPKRADSACFVVPASRTDASENAAEDAYNECMDMWHGSEYADLRRELLAWMIEELKK